MYGLHSDPKIDVLKGETLIQVCFGENDLILNFSGDISIATFSCIALGSDQQPATIYEAFVAISGELLNLLSKAVVDVKWTKEGTLSITFSSGNLVHFYDDSERYESYTITTPSGVVVV